MRYCDYLVIFRRVINARRSYGKIEAGDEGKLALLRASCSPLQHTFSVFLYVPLCLCGEIFSSVFRSMRFCDIHRSTL
jgi:hypothetical protein